MKGQSLTGPRSDSERTSCRRPTSMSPRLTGFSQLGQLSSRSGVIRIETPFFRDYRVACRRTSCYHPNSSCRLEDLAL